jgi:hypothetical protein
MVKNIRMLFLPAVISGIIVGYILYWCYTFAMLYTTPNLVLPTNFQQQKSLDYSDCGYIKLFYIFFIFGLIWWIEIFSNISKFSIMVGTANWYFNTE